MNIRQQAHTKMFSAVLGVMDKYNPVWINSSAFVDAHDGLNDIINNIRDEELKQSGKTTGVTENKRTARTAMCAAAAVVGGAVAQLAETQARHDLFDTVDFSAPDLLHQTEADCLTNCTAIYNAANANIAALTAAGTLAAADVTDLNTKIGAFNGQLTQPRQVKAGTKAATDLLAEAIIAGDRICERQLDKLMERFKATNPDFYLAYQVARLIVDAGGNTAAPTPAPATPKP